MCLIVIVRPTELGKNQVVKHCGRPQSLKQQSDVSSSCSSEVILISGFHRDVINILPSKGFII